MRVEISCIVLFWIQCKELQEQLELRIPDKFLQANGWK